MNSMHASQYQNKRTATILKTSYSSPMTDAMKSYSWAWFFMILLLGPCYYVYSMSCNKKEKIIDESTTFAHKHVYYNYKAPDCSKSAPPLRQVHYGQKQQA